MGGGEPPREPRTLVLSIDIGSTHSAVAVSYRPQRSTSRFLGFSSNSRPSGPDIVTSVDRWPGQEHFPHEQRVPSALLYDATGKLVACGASAESQAGQVNQANWTVIKHFKMHLYPSQQRSGEEQLEIRPNLPPKVIYADFLRYLLLHTRQHLITEVGSDVWLKHDREDDTKIVLSHPNTWDAEEQLILMSAVVDAGLIPESRVALDLHFLNEDLASLSFYVSTRLSSPSDLTGTTRLITCDIGGLTCHIAVYDVDPRSSTYLTVTPACSPICLYAGGVSVDQALEQHILNKLYGSLQGGLLSGALADAVEEFKWHIKCRFRMSPSHAPYLIKVGGSKLNNPELGIANGFLTINEDAIESFFKPTVGKVIHQLHLFIETHDVHTLLLAGAFSDSPYVRDRMVEAFGAHTSIVSLSKVVAIGALKHPVRGVGVGK